MFLSWGCWVSPQGIQILFVWSRKQDYLFQSLQMIFYTPLSWEPWFQIFLKTIFLLFCSFVVQSLNYVRLFATSWTAALPCTQASLSFTVSWSLLRLTSSELVMPSNHLILCHPLLLLPSMCPSIRSFPMSHNMSLSKLREIVKDREAWHAAVPGVTKSQTGLSDWTTTKFLASHCTHCFFCH